jgi:energy-coupling factor transport system ATP-binding protein
VTDPVATERHSEVVGGKPDPVTDRGPRVGLRLVSALAGIVVSTLLQTIPLLAVFLVALYAGAVARRLDVRALLRRNIPILPVIVSMIVIHGWANPANVHWIGWFGVEGLTFGTVTSLRLLCFLAVANIFLLATPVHEVVRWTRDHNRDLGLMVSMAFTITPILSEQMAVTLQAQQVRGMPVGPGIVTKVKAYTQVLIPVVVKALTRAEQMSLLLLARGYERSAPEGGGVLPDSEGSAFEALGFGFAYTGAAGWSLRDVDLVAPVGRLTGLIGSSGSGKTTLLACLAGDPPATPAGFVSGQVLVGGESYAPARPFAALVLQNPGIHLFDTPLAEVAFSWECRGMRHDDAERVALGELGALGVAHLAGRQLRTLSGGERQRVALAAAFATGPAALALDEPFEQLDQTGVAEVAARVREFAAQGHSVLLATRSREVAALCDPVIGLASGSVVEAAAALPAIHTIERQTAPRGPEALRLDDVTYRYEQGGGVECVSFGVHAGETVALLGDNGAGKSTILRLAVGLLEPQAGGVLLLSGAPAKLGPLEVSRRAAMLFQDPDDQIFNPRVDEEIEWALKIRGVAAEERTRIVGSVMREFGLERYAASHPHEMSRSARQLVALASALVTDPPVLFLDEPTTALDETSVALAFAAVERRRTKGAAVIVVTHDEDVAVSWADRTVRLESGRVVGHSEGDA